MPHKKSIKNLAKKATIYFVAISTILSMTGGSALASIPQVTSVTVSETSAKIVFDQNVKNASTTSPYNYEYPMRWNFELWSPIDTPYPLTGEQWTGYYVSPPVNGVSRIFGLDLNEGDTWRMRISSIRAVTPPTDAFQQLFATSTAPGYTNVVASTDPLITNLSIGAALQTTTLTIDGVRFGVLPGALPVVSNAKIDFAPNVPGAWHQFITSTSTDIISWSDNQIKFRVPSQDASGTSIATGRYNFNIRDNDYDESQYVSFTIATDTASYITGRVTSGSGALNGVSNVNVFTYIPGQPTNIPGTQSTVNGWYTLGPISATGTYYVRAQASGYMSDEATTSIGAMGEIDTVNLTLSSLPAKITGNISGPGGAFATTSVNIQAFDVNAKGQPPYGAHASSTGAYSIDIPYGTYYVQPIYEGGGYASVPNSRTATVSSSATTSTANNFTMTQLTKAIKGQVTNQTGQTLDWTTIRVDAFIPGSQTPPYWANLSGNCGSATTCSYTLYVPAGTYDVSIWLETYGVDPAKTAATVTSEADALGVNFAIKNYTATLSGKVKDVVGQGIANAGVFAQKVGEEYGGVGRMTDSSGNYLLGLTALGTYNIFIDPPFGSSYLRPEPTEMNITQSTTSDFVLNQAVKQIRVTVKLGDATQTDAVVMAFKEGAPGWAETWQQTGGIYTLNVGSGSWKVMTRPQNPDADWAYLAEPYPVTFTLSDSAAETQSITLTVSTADATVQGKILKPDSSPVTRGGVDIRQPGGSGTHSPLGNDGGFLVKVPAGTYQLNVFAEDQRLTLPATATAPFTVASNATKNFGNIVMQTKTATISGTVSDSEESPLSGIRIHTHKMEGMGWADTVSDASGSYTLYVTSGFWEVMPDPMGSEDYVSTQPPQRVSVGTNTSNVTGVDFTLVSATSKINGRVVSGGNVVNSLSGFAFAYSSTVFTGAPINNGTFGIKVPAGTYTVGVGLPPNSDYVLDEEQSVTVASGETENVDISVTQAAATLSGWVKDEAGQNLPSDTAVWIFAVKNIGAKGAWRETKTTVSGGAHTYSLNLTTGEWSIGYWIDSLDYINKPPADAAITISEGANTKNIAVSKADATIQGTVYAPDGTTTLPYAFVFADSGMAGATEKIHTGTETGANGAYSLKVKSGKYKVGAGLPPEFSTYINPDLVEVDVASTTPSTVNLTFKTANSQITGTVYDIDGVTAHKAFVWAWSDKGGYSETFTMSGVYTLNVNDNDIWHTGAAYDAEENYYEATEVAVNIPSGTTSTEQNLTLVLKGTKAKSYTITFDATENQVISLSDGTKIQIPAGSLASSGNVTVAITPTSQIARQSGARPLGLAYDITATPASGQSLNTTFNPKVIITIPYTQAQLDALGITINDVKVGYWSEASQMWVSVDSITIDTTNKLISFSIDHFTPIGGYGEGDTTPPTFAGASSATAVSTSAINLSWTAATDNVDAASAIVYRIYRSTTSGGQNFSSPLATTSAGATSYQATELSASTKYYFVVRAKDTSGNEDTNTIEVSATTQSAAVTGGGGGLPQGAYLAPAEPAGGFVILINSGAEITTLREVTLTLNGGSDAVKMAISENANFAGAVQETYATTKTWTLSSGDGAKTVYAKFYTQYGVASAAVSDSITLQTAVEEVVEVPVVEEEIEVPVVEKPITKMTVAELKAKVVELLAKVLQLKNMLAALVAPEIEGIPGGFKFETTLKYGQTSEDVRYLQIFLKSQGKEIYPEGIVSGWFGPLTKAAVIRFQEKYAEDVLASWGLTEGTGIVGKTTRAKINELLGR